MGRRAQTTYRLDDPAQRQLAEAAPQRLSALPRLDVEVISGSDFAAAHGQEMS